MAPAPAEASSAPAAPPSTEASTPSSAAPPPADPDPPAAIPTPYPTVYCVVGDVLSGRWMIDIDPTTKADLARAERLLDRYPDADGHTGALHRGNVPAAWRELRDVTLVTPEGPSTTRVKKVGVRPSPSGGSFAFVLEAKTPHTDDTPAFALEGHVETSGLEWASISKPPLLDDARWASLQGPLEDYVAARRPRAGRPTLRPESAVWVEADIGGGIEGFVVITTRPRAGRFPTWSAIAAVDAKGALVAVPLRQSDDPAPPEGMLEHAFFRPLGSFDLDHDGHAELVLREEWPEGAFTWIVRFDAVRGELAASRICGDAS